MKRQNPFEAVFCHNRMLVIFPEHYISGHQFVKDAPHLFPYSFGYAQVEPAPADHLLFFISDDLQTSFIDKRNPSLSIQRYYQHSRDVEILLRSEEHTSELQSRLHLVCRL